MSKSMRVEFLIFFFINLLVIIHSCELGWFKLNDDKCIKVYNVSASYDESVQFCDFAHKANILSIDTQNEQKFWTFYLFRYLNLTENIWIQSPVSSKNMTSLKFSDSTILGSIQSKTVNNSCFAMQSFSGALNQTQNVGFISLRSCNLFSLTVCQLVTLKVENKPEPKIINPNSEFFPNMKLKDSDGNVTEIFTGLYYKIVSKYNHEAINGKLFGLGKCSLKSNGGKDCKNYYKSPNVDSNQDLSTSFMMTTKDKESRYFRLKRQSNTNELVSFSDQGLQTFDCFKDGVVTNNCDFTYEMNNINPLWELQASEQKGYYKIHSKTKDETVMGLNHLIDEKYNETVSSLYDDSNNRNDSRILFSFVLQNYSLIAELYSVEWDKSIEEIVESNKQQVSLIDTAVINNDSPASLSHEVSVEKKLTESFTTTFGTNMRFLRSMSLRDEMSASDTDSSSATKSFTQSASEAVSQSLSQSMSSTQTDSHSNSKSSNTDGSASVNAGFMGIGASASISHSSGRSSTDDHSNSRTDSTEQSNSKTHTDENSKTNSDEKSKSLTKGKTNSTENTSSSERTTENSHQVMTSKEHTYRLSKIVTVPPYSAVKISSYANWISDMQLHFKLNIKFTAKALRRKMDGKASNEYRTLESEVVKSLMSFHNFPGIIIKNHSDTVYGQITGSISASVGLDSVFISKGVNLNDNGVNDSPD